MTQMLKPQRYRGFVLTATGLQKLQAQIHQLEMQTRLRQNAKAIAQRVQLVDPEGIHPMTVRKMLRAQLGVDKRSLNAVFKALQLSLEDGDFAHANLCQEASLNMVVLPRIFVERTPVEGNSFLEQHNVSIERG